MTYKTDNGRATVDIAGEGFYRVLLTPQTGRPYQAWICAESHYHAAKEAYRIRYGEDTLLRSMI